MSSKTPLYSWWLSEHLALSRYSINVCWLTDEWMNEFQSPEGITWEALSESVSYTTSFLAAGNETDGKPLKFWGCLSLREPSGQPAMGRTVVAQVFHSFCVFFFSHITQISIDIMGEAVAQMDTHSALTDLSDGCCYSVAVLATPWTAAHQASLSFTVSQSVLTLMSIDSNFLQH